eukprot:jgi/Galph1/5009/GphlegSOOS_G3671.1
MRLRLILPVVAAAIGFSLMQSSCKECLARDLQNITGGPEEHSNLSVKEKSIQNTRVTGEAAKIFAEAKKSAELRNFEEAEKLYERVISASPTFAPAYSNLANIQVLHKKYPTAVENYTKALELAPQAADSWVIYLNRANVWIALQEYNKAEEDINLAKHFKPKESLVFSSRANLFASQGRWDEASVEYEKAVESRPNDVQLFWFNYGLTLFERGKTFETLSVLTRVARKFPKLSDVYAALAAVEYTRGNLTAAETYWNSVDHPKIYTSEYLLHERKWPPKIVDALQAFRSLSVQS